MNIYKTELWFSDGRHYEDYWVAKEDALSYIERADKFNNCTRAEAWEMGADESNLKYENKNCLYEWDVNGKYYYKVA